MKYVVWKRNDGYVAATTYMPTPYCDGGPYDEDVPWVANQTTFVKLGEFTEWKDAANCIQQARECV